MGPDAAEDPAAGPARTGWFDGVRSHRLQGWATGGPTPLTVRLRTREGAAVDVLADQFRADVQAAGLGDGFCGFSLSLDRLPGAAAGVECVWADDETPLPGSPWTPEAAPWSVHEADEVQIVLDRRPPGDVQVTGWACNRAQPERRVRLALWSGSGCVADGRATLYRPESRSGGGDGFHGFALATGPGRRSLWLVDLDRRKPLLRLRGSGS